MDMMRKLDKNIAVTAAFLGALTIALGAFGAHGLKEIIDAPSVDGFNTGVRYQMYHSLVLLLIGLTPRISEPTKKWVFRLMIAGVILFSGSIYVLSIKEHLPFNASSIGFITPLGGILIILAWLRLAFGLIVNK